MIGDSGLSVNTAEANKKCILDFTIIYKKKKNHSRKLSLCEVTGATETFFLY